MTATEDLTLTDIMEHLGAAWSTCGEAAGSVADCLDDFDLVSDLLLDSVRASLPGAALNVEANLRAKIEATCPGLLAAARIYAQHVEAGWPHPYDEQRVRALFAEHMGRDPFGQPTPG